MTNFWDFYNSYHSARCKIAGARECDIGIIREIRDKYILVQLRRVVIGELDHIYIHIFCGRSNGC